MLLQNSFRYGKADYIQDAGTQPIEEAQTVTTNLEHLKTAVLPQQATKYIALINTAFHKQTTKCVQTKFVCIRLQATPPQRHNRRKDT